MPAEAEPKATLMENQDENKGSGAGPKRRKPEVRKKSVCVTFWCTPEQKEAIQTYADGHYMSMSRLIQEGLEMRMKEG